MNVQRDPELGKMLEVGLPPPNAPYGAKLRVRRRLDEQLARARPFVPTALAAAVATIACAVALYLGLGATTANNAPTAPREPFFG